MWIKIGVTNLKYSPYSRIKGGYKAPYFTRLIALVVPPPKEITIKYMNIMVKNIKVTLALLYRLTRLSNKKSTPRSILKK